MRNLGDGPHHMVLYEIHETKHSVYVVCDYLPGGELITEISQNEKLKESKVRKIIQNILKGLYHCHSRGIMHRDLKPENLMLASKKAIHKVKIIDFGLGQFVDEEDYLYKRCGTPGFVAPEILALNDGE